MPSLITKFRTHLRPHIFQKMIAFRFSSLVDCYAAALQVKTSLDMRNIKRAQAQGHNDGDSHKITHRSEGGGWHIQGHHSGGSSLSNDSGGRGQVPMVILSMASRVTVGINVLFILYKDHFYHPRAHSQSGYASFQSPPRQTQSHQSSFTTPHQTQQQYQHQFVLRRLAIRVIHQDIRNCLGVRLLLGFRFMA